MGLAGRKEKQRIPADPRNLSWADDASRFGHTYLSKFGWDASQGLGSSGDGMKTYLKVHQKLDMMGIGAEHQRDPNGIAWKQNKEFEALLKRLNESAEQGKAADGEDAEGVGGGERETAMGKAFVRAQERKDEGTLGDESSVTTKKRKHKDRDDPDTSENTTKKQKKEKRQKSSSDDSSSPAIDSNSPSALSLPGSHSEPIPKSRPMAHRARIRAAKRIEGKSASAISEILGIAPSSFMSTPTSTPAPTPPSSSTPVPQPSVSLGNLTTSTKSVADYFKEKLLARSSSSFFSASSSSSTPSGSATPGLGATRPGPRLSDVSPPDDEGEPPRRGIGSQAPAINVDGRDMLTEKQRQKAERKAETRKRKRQDPEATPECVSTDAKQQTEGDDAEIAQTTSKKEKKRRERKQQAPVDQPNDNDDDITEKSHEHDTPGGSLPEPSKKHKKEHKKKTFVSTRWR